MAARLEDASFTIIRVITHGARQDGTLTKNKYAIDVEVSWGVFPATLPRGTDRIKLSQPLKLHPAAKAIAQAVTEVVKRLEVDSRIGGASRAILELAAPSPGAAAKTSNAVVKLRELNARKAIEKP